MKKPVNMHAVALASAALAAAVAPKKAEAPPAAAVGNDGTSVVLVYDRAVEFAAMTPEGALELAQALVGHAIALNPAIGNRVFMPVDAVPANSERDSLQEPELTPSYPENTDTARLGQQPDDQWAKDVCLMGQGDRTCSFLGAGPNGLICAKSDASILPVILERRAAGTMKAKGNNCPGLGGEPAQILDAPGAGTVH